MKDTYEIPLTPLVMTRQQPEDLLTTESYYCYMYQFDGRGNGYSVWIVSMLTGSRKDCIGSGMTKRAAVSFCSKKNMEDV